MSAISQNIGPCFGTVSKSFYLTTPKGDHYMTELEICGRRGGRVGV